MYNISVIVPFYKGNKYLKRLKFFLEAACNLYSGTVEVIMVNDSPEVSIDKKMIQSDKYNLVVVNHDMNHGIHKARVTGLQKAQGDYVLFLDQDDKISKDFFKEMTKFLDEDNSIAFTYANGIFEDENGKSKLILNSYGKVFGAQNYSVYLKSGNLLASPGQCLIRKDAIPREWTENIMHTNCADDFLLWILILKYQKAKYVNKLLYEHITTGENVSKNKLNGYKSDLEVCEILECLDLLSKKELSNFRKRCVSNYNKEKGTDYNHFDWILSRQVDYIERLRMKLIGIVFELIRKEII